MFAGFFPSSHTVSIAFAFTFANCKGMNTTALVMQYYRGHLTFTQYHTSSASNSYDTISKRFCPAIDFRLWSGNNVISAAAWKGLLVSAASWEGFAQLCQIAPVEICCSGNSPLLSEVIFIILGPPIILILQVNWLFFTQLHEALWIKSKCLENKGSCSCVVGELYCL